MRIITCTTLRHWSVALGIGLCLVTLWAGADERYFAGHVAYRGDRLALRLALDEDAPAARIDLPELWYAEVPAKLTAGEGGILALELPFGIGNIELKQADGGFRGTRKGFGIVLEPAPPPPYRKREVSFGAFAPELGGTLYLPDGDEPRPAVVLVAGSSSAERSSWAYRSKADYYARLGVSALVYDRRPWGELADTGGDADFWTHTEDLRTAVEALTSTLEHAPSNVGVHAGSQGVWISLIAQQRHGLFDWAVLTGAPAVTPAEQQMQSLVRGMQDDGVPPGSIADAVAYQRLYFAVAHRQRGWAELERAVAGLEGQPWAEYVDRPRSLADLAWWHRHMNHDPAPVLSTLGIPLLVMNGTRDWVTPAERNLPLFDHYARRAGNDRVTTRTLRGADHRLETRPGVDESGTWRFFRIHPQAREAIEAFLAANAFRNQAEP